MFSSLYFCPDFPCLGQPGLFFVYLIIQFLLLVILRVGFFLPLGNPAEFSVQNLKKY